MYTISTVLFAILASLSPLLTFAYLWQLKEWRWDRLRTHLLEEGWLRQLTGVLRPIVIAVAITAIALDLAPVEHIVVTALAILAGLTVTQVLLRRQPKPVWTQKAMTVVAFALLFTSSMIAVLGVTPGMEAAITLLFVPLLQPMSIAIALMVLLPLDRTLKYRVLKTAMAVRSHFPDAVVIGVTGSVGKTTTKELIAHILQERSPLVTPAYVNTEMGIAQWLIRELPRQNSPLIIAEMGAYRKGEIALLCRILKPQMGVITLIGTQHLALFGSQEALLNTKAELIESLPTDGHAFLNGDHELTRSLKDRAACPVTIVGTGGVSDLEAFDIDETREGIRFRVHDTSFLVPLHGTHNVVNVLLATAVAQHLGMSLPDIARRLQSYKPPSHTFAVKKERSVTLLDDTHNSSAASFKAAIAWARSQPFSHKTLLAAGLMELGEEQDREHAQLGAASANVFQRVIFQNKKSAQQFARGFSKPVEIVSKEMHPVPENSLLVCIGRIPLSTIQRLIP